MACSRFVLGNTALLAIGILGASLAAASNLDTEGTLAPRRLPLKVLVTQHPDSPPRPQWHAIPNLSDLQYRGGAGTDSVIAAYRGFTFGLDGSDRFSPAASGSGDGWHGAPHKRDFEQNEDRWEHFEHEHEHEHQHEHPSPVPLPPALLLFTSGAVLLASLRLIFRRGQRSKILGRGVMVLEPEL